MKPDEVLDMSLDVLKAVIRGYTDHMFDLQLISVQQGYWAGYYNRAKKPKSLETILKKLLKSRTKDSHKESSKKSQQNMEVDVETFLKREQQRLAQLNIIK